MQGRSACKHLVRRKEAIRIQVAKCMVPKLVPYHKLLSYIKSMDIGKLYSIRDKHCEGLGDMDKVNGCNQNLEELLLKIGKFYLCNNLCEILTFDAEPNIFHVALGGDGAPFGKDNSACAWLVSILNIGKRVFSSAENFYCLVQIVMKPACQ